jgi:tetratricopeptide (TPR) repeat protein
MLVPQVLIQRLIQTNLKNTYEMHRLVQLAMILWLKSHRKLANWQEKALSKLEDEFPVYNFELSALCESLYPHARLVVEYRFGDPRTRLVHASLMTQVAVYEASRYNLEVAHGRLISACECREELLGRDHILTLRSRLHLAGTLRLQESAEAEAIYRELLPKFEELTGPDSNDALAVKMDLALSLKDGMQAEKLLREVIDGAQKAVEMENYAIALDNLGVCLLSQGKREESVKYHQMALEEKEKLLGPNHASTLLSMMNLNTATDPSDKEEELSREILAKQEQILGPEHPDTLLSLINLSRSLMRDRRYEDAEPLALRALAGKEKVLGANHPQTLTAMDTVAVLYCLMEQYEISKVYFERALKGFDKVLGQSDRRTQSCWWGYLALPPEWCSLDKVMPKEFAKDHPVSIVRLNCEASTLYDKGDYRQAEELQRKALALFEGTLGRDELWTLACAHDLGLTLIELWKFGEAEDLFRRVLAGRKRQLTPDHRDTLRTMNALGVTLWNLKDDKLLEAEQLFRDLLAIRETLGQTEDASYLATRNNLGLLEFERKDNAAAVKTYKALLVDRERIQGPDHPETLLCMLSISMALGYEGEYEESRDWNEKALRGLTINPGSEHPNTLVAQSHLAKILSMLGKLDEAEATVRSVITAREKVLGPGHGNTLKSRGRLAGIFEMQGRFDEALALEEDVYAAAVESLGIDHPETRGHKECLDDLKYRMGQEVLEVSGSSEDKSEGSGDESSPSEDETSK